jgi:hypothetical protein
VRTAKPLILSPVETALWPMRRRRWGLGSRFGAAQGDESVSKSRDRCRNPERLSGSKYEFVEAGI